MLSARSSFNSYSHPNEYFHGTRFQRSSISLSGRKFAKKALVEVVNIRADITFLVSLETAEIMIAKGQAVWDQTGLKRLIEIGRVRTDAREWRKRKSGKHGPSVMQFVPLGSVGPRKR